MLQTDSSTAFLDRSSMLGRWMQLHPDGRLAPVTKPDSCQLEVVPADRDGLERWECFNGQEALETAGVCG